MAALHRPTTSTPSGPWRAGLPCPDQRGVQVSAAGDDGVRAGSGQERHHVTRRLGDDTWMSCTGVQEATAWVKPEVLEQAQGAGSQPVAADLVAGTSPCPPPRRAGRPSGQRRWWRRCRRGRHRRRRHLRSGTRGTRGQPTASPRPRGQPRRRGSGAGAASSSACRRRASAARTSSHPARWHSTNRAGSVTAAGSIADPDVHVVQVGEQGHAGLRAGEGPEGGDGGRCGCRR